MMAEACLQILLDDEATVEERSDSLAAHADLSSHLKMSVNGVLWWGRLVGKQRT